MNGGVSEHNFIHFFIFCQKCYRELWKDFFIFFIRKRKEIMHWYCNPI